MNSSFTAISRMGLQSLSDSLRDWMPTLGGLQHWADVYIFRDWRIQLHVHTGRHRLLDAWNFERAHGSFEDCRHVLDQIRMNQGHIEEPQGPRVVILHGLIRTRRSMDVLARHLRQHGMNAYTVGYPSLQIAIGSHARHLQQIISGLEGDDPIHIVGHSMGGLITRAYLELGPDPRIKRIVMIGTPNQGAEKATLVQRTGLLPFIGPAACQLVPGDGGIVHQLASNPTSLYGVEIGIIAAGGPGGRGYTNLIPCDNDGVVTVASTMLAGAADFHLVRGIHTFMPSLLTVRDATERFLRYGYFRTESDRHPIESIRWVGHQGRRPVVLPANPTLR